MPDDLPGGIQPATEALVLHVEEVDGADKRWQGMGTFRGRKHSKTATVRDVVPVATEDLDAERAPVVEGDTGRIESLPDGSISIPVYAEELVVTKRVVLKERLILRKRTVVEERTIEDTLRYEQVEFDADDEVKGLVEWREGPSE
jgi:uncharacterized protein (TIGR02271 family)